MAARGVPRPGSVDPPADESRPARRELHVGLHPATPALYLAAGDSGNVRAIAETVSGGPGYHRFVGRVLERLGQELAIDWDEATAGIAFAERPEVERAYLGWLGPTLAAVRNARQRSSAGVQVGTPPGTRYTFEGAIATSLGPRDDAWLESAIADPRVAIEITPWWLDATDGRYLLNRALALMWLEVRWRKPAVEGEAERLEDVHRLLSKAFPIEPGLPYPWHAWAELISFGGFEDGMTRQVQFAFEARTARGADRLPAGSGVDQPRGLGARDPGRVRRAPDRGGMVGRRRRTERHAGRDRRRARWPRRRSWPRSRAISAARRSRTRLGRSWAGRGSTSDESSGVAVGVLDGYSAVNGSGAAIRIVFDDPNDWQWALDMWRSLAPG